MTLANLKLTAATTDQRLQNWTETQRGGRRPQPTAEIHESILRQDIIWFYREVVDFTQEYSVNAKLFTFKTKTCAYDEQVLLACYYNRITPSFIAPTVTGEVSFRKWYPRAVYRELRRS